jgi:hypothetical protein
MANERIQDLNASLVVSSKTSLQASELDAQMSILKIEKELEKARLKLAQVRKYRYSMSSQGSATSSVPLGGVEERRSSALMESAGAASVNKVLENADEETRSNVLDMARRFTEASLESSLSKVKGKERGKTSQRASLPVIPTINTRGPSSTASYSIRGASPNSTGNNSAGISNSHNLVGLFSMRRDSLTQQQGFTTAPSSPSFETAPSSPWSNTGPPNEAVSVNVNPTLALPERRGSTRRFSNMSSSSGNYTSATTSTPGPGGATSSNVQMSTKPRSSFISGQQKGVRKDLGGVAPFKLAALEEVETPNDD